MVLIAVALFAALSYAVTTSNRGSGSIDKEQARIEASRLIQYGTTIRDAMIKVKIMTGYEPWLLDTQCVGILTYGGYNFCNSAAGAYSQCAENDCRLFISPGWGNPDVGWVTPIVPDTKAFVPDSSLALGYARRHFIHWIQITGVGTTIPEMVLTLYGVKDEVCRQINDIVGLGEVIPSDAYTRVQFSNWTSTSPATVTTNIVGDDEPLLAGHNVYCVADIIGMNSFNFAIAEL